jgi:hypothetical protein
VIDTLRLAGAPEEVIEQAEADMAAAVAAADDGGFEVHADNWKTFMFFCSLQTQWDIVVLPDGRTRRAGLKWPSVEIGIDHAIARGDFKRRDRTALFDDVTMMELEAVKVFSELT